MLQTDLLQATAECAEWRQVLRNYRNELNLNQKELEGLLQLPITKDRMLEVERFQNLFYLHLINIHDLKQVIKAHEHKLQAELQEKGHVTPETLNRQEELYEAFSAMELTLLDLRVDFQTFASTIE